MTVNWKQTVENGDLVICSIKEARDKKIFPNRLAWPKDQPRVGALVVFQSDNNLFAVGKNGLDFMITAIGDNRFDAGVVLLLRQGKNDKPEFMNVHPVENILVELHDKPPSGWFDSEGGI